jgi:hypothetical protein
LDWEWLRQLVFPLVCHLPGEEGGEVWWRLAAMGDTGVAERAQPMAGIEAPHEESLQHAQHHRGEVRTPDAAGAIRVLAPDDRGTQGPFGTVVVQRHCWPRQEDGEPAPVVVETLENRALRLVEIALLTIHLTAVLHLT